MNKTLYFTAAIAAISLLASPLRGQNLLTNGGFEADAAGAAPSGWTLVLSGAAGSTSTAYANSGSNSLMLDSTGASAWSSPNVIQTFPASEGDIYNFSGYLATPVAISGASFGLLKIEFKNASGALVAPAAVSIGGSAGSPFFGAESTPFLNTSSAVETWIFTETEATAPAGTASVTFVILNVNAPNDARQMYYDDIAAVHVNGEAAWAGYPWLDDAGTVDTGEFLGFLNVGSPDYVWSFSLQNWMFLPEDHVTEAGAWTYIFAR